MPGCAGIPALLTCHSLDLCEQRCCAEPLCHSVVWVDSSRSCVALLAIAHGARREDWCWRPVLSQGATTSVRLPGAWEARAVEAAVQVLRAPSFVRRASATPGPHVFRKRGGWTTPAGHEHPLERSVEAVACEASAAGRLALDVSDVLIGAIPIGDPRPGRRNDRALSCG